MNFDNVFYYKSIDSTQKEAWRLYESYDKDEIIVIADSQENGIGTHGRVWYTGYGNIAFSILFKTKITNIKLDGLTYKIAEIVSNVLKEDYNISINIKLPNDLMINNKKVGGILVETKLQKDLVKAIVVGIGINTIEAPNDSNINAIAIKDVYTVDINNKNLIFRICNNIKEELLERIK